MHSLLFLLYLSTYIHYFCKPTFYAVPQSRSNLRLLSNSPTARNHVCVCSSLCIFSGRLSGESPDVRPAVCGLNPWLPLQLQFQPSLHCLGDKPLHLCPSENTTALTKMLSHPSTCILALRLQSTTPKAKQMVFCLHLSPTICDHRGDRGICCCCNRPIVLCLRS